jgi:ubiquinone/menaquinone biosynthesis C-methylase UbiE
VRRKGTYEDVAAEYYDAPKHPTSANFRAASQRVLVSWKYQVIGESNRWMCEVGPGDSLVAQTFHDRLDVMRRLLLVDLSVTMLSWSRRWRARGAHLVLADAARMPFAAATLDCVVSILGDAYNTPGFWEEVARILTPGGRALYTSPSSVWVQAFRNSEHTDPQRAEFEIVGAPPVLVPSNVLTLDDQTKAIEETGLLVRDISQVSVADFSAKSLSPKLRILGQADPVIDAYLVCKP